MCSDISSRSYLLLNWQSRNEKKNKTSHDVTQVTMLHNLVYSASINELTETP